MNWSFPLTAEIGCYVITPRQWRSTGTRASADKPRRWPNATKVIVAGRARTASKPMTASVTGWTTATLGCSSWATRRAAPPMGGLKELTGAGSMRTTITLRPKKHSSIRRSDLSTAGVNEGVPTIGTGRPRIGNDRMLGRVGSARLSLSSGTSTGCVGTLSAGRAAKLRDCGVRLVGLVVQDVRAGLLGQVRQDAFNEGDLVLLDRAEPSPFVTEVHAVVLPHA